MRPRPSDVETENNKADYSDLWKEIAKGKPDLVISLAHNCSAGRVARAKRFYRAYSVLQINTLVLTNGEVIKLSKPMANKVAEIVTATTTTSKKMHIIGWSKFKVNEIETNIENIESLSGLKLDITSFPQFIVKNGRKI